MHITRDTLHFFEKKEEIYCVPPPTSTLNSSTAIDNLLKNYVSILKSIPKQTTFECKQDFYSKTNIFVFFPKIRSPESYFNYHTNGFLIRTPYELIHVSYTEIVSSCRFQNWSSGAYS